MTDVQIVEILKAMTFTGVKVAGPILGVCLVVGILVSILQTITQIQEQAIAFVAKLAAVVVVCMLGGPWMLQEIRSLIVELWGRIPGLA